MRTTSVRWRHAAALLQLELDRGEHLRRREGAQVVEVAGVVRRLQADEDHLGDALEGGRVEVGGKAGRCDRRALRQRRARGAASGATGAPVEAAATAPAARRGTTLRALRHRGAGARELHAAGAQPPDSTA